ncbi:hypothetical protein Tco_0699343 [Tanacetum coccineum]
MIAPGSSRYSSNDMVHNHYLEEARKRHKKGRNSEPSVMPSARSQSTANGSKPKTRINNTKSRKWAASKSIATRAAPRQSCAHSTLNIHEKNEYKGRMPTKIELTLEQSQQGVSNDVLVIIEGVEELKRNVWIKGLKRSPPHNLGRYGSIHMLQNHQLLIADIEDDIMDLSVNRDLRIILVILPELFRSDTRSYSSMTNGNPSSVIIKRNAVG